MLAIVVLLVVATAPSTARTDARTKPDTTDLPATVYVSEELDISEIRRTGGGRIGDARVRLQRLGGLRPPVIMSAPVRLIEKSALPELNGGQADLQSAALPG